MERVGKGWIASLLPITLLLLLSLAPNSAWAIDSDGDGLSDLDELAVHFIDPNNPDTDGGGATDGAEVHCSGTDPLNPADDILLADADVDGVPDGCDL
jgi:hypothetical protein